MTLFIFVHQPLRYSLSIISSLFLAGPSKTQSDRMATSSTTPAGAIPHFNTKLNSQREHGWMNGHPLHQPTHISNAYGLQFAAQQLSNQSIIISITPSEYHDPSNALMPGGSLFSPGGLGALLAVMVNNTPSILAAAVSSSIASASRTELATHTPTNNEVFLSSPSIEDRSSPLFGSRGDLSCATPGDNLTSSREHTPRGFTRSNSISSSGKRPLDASVSTPTPKRQNRGVAVSPPRLTSPGSTVETDDGEEVDVVATGLLYPSSSFAGLPGAVEETNKESFSNAGPSTPPTRANLSVSPTLSLTDSPRNMVKYLLAPRRRESRQDWQ
ncbi:hypothetical protein JAAARDRAFT_358111 [Jaapia argillacea MUCL 33604]|uniref:Uncharacterized protein n=1 Tax=Jaapia argillacea MUCL 33604 TaxID=933084 RepID=A0A067Q9M7_9AGAM|nr:hypothetical protein JAAARDRAFT_358111 [Jaapia argillacea MUCL 33604]